jgi:hypothetical protein
MVREPKKAQEQLPAVLVTVKARYAKHAILFLEHLPQRVLVPNALARALFQKNLVTSAAEKASREGRRKL